MAEGISGGWKGPTGSERQGQLLTKGELGAHLKFKSKKAIIVQGLSLAPFGSKIITALRIAPLPFVQNFVI